MKIARRVAIAYLSVCLLMTFLERWLVYPAPPTDEYDWSPDHLQFEDVYFTAEDQVRLHGWFFEHPDPKYTVLYMHGNGEHVAHAGELMPAIVDRLQASVLVYDYRGYGHSQGKPHENGLIKDAVAASQWLTQRTGTPSEKQVLIGRSIGGAVAVALAQRQGAGCLVLQSTFARLTDIAAEMFPWLPVRWLMVNQYPSVDRIRDYPGPVFASHGDADQVAPLQQGRRLYQAAPTDDKQLLVVEAMGHNEVMTSDYWDQLRAFLDSLGLNG